MFSEFIISGRACIDSSNAEDGPGVASTKSLPVITTSLSIDASSDTNNGITSTPPEDAVTSTPLLEVLMYIEVIPSRGYIRWYHLNNIIHVHVRLRCLN